MFSPAVLPCPTPNVYWVLMTAPNALPQDTTLELPMTIYKPKPFTRNFVYLPWVPQTGCRCWHPPAYHRQWWCWTPLMFALLPFGPSTTLTPRDSSGTLVHSNICYPTNLICPCPQEYLLLSSDRHFCPPLTTPMTLPTWQSPSWLLHILSLVTYPSFQYLKSNHIRVSPCMWGFYDRKCNKSQWDAPHTSEIVYNGQRIDSCLPT